MSIPLHPLQSVTDAHGQNYCHYFAVENMKSKR